MLIFSISNEDLQKFKNHTALYENSPSETFMRALIKEIKNHSYFEIIIFGMLKFIHSNRVSDFDGIGENVFSWFPLKITYFVHEFPSFYACRTDLGLLDMSKNDIRCDKFDKWKDKKKLLYVSFIVSVWLHETNGANYRLSHAFK